MSRYIPKRPKIEEVGLRKWLDESKDEHNGHGYDRFVEMLGSDLNFTKPQIATEFGVTKDTIYQWLAIHEREAAK